MQLPFSTLPAPRTHRVDARFVPSGCPNPTCGTRSGADFDYACAGTYQRACDLRIVQRYRCLVCRSRFSSQAFRVDYRLRKPWLPLAVFQGLVAKTSLRQIARSLGCKLDTVLNHLRLVGQRGHELHTLFLARYVAERASTGMIGVNIGVPVPREPFSFGGTKHSKFGHGDITGRPALEFWTDLKKITTKWALQPDATWMS